MSGLKRDFVTAVRSLQRAPGVALLAIGMLAVGIGANTAVFSVVDAVLLRSLPYRQPDRIVRIWTTAPDRGLDLAEFSLQRSLDVAARNTAFSAVGAFTPDTVTVTGAGEPVPLRAARVSAAVPAVLGVRPALGRGFLPIEDVAGGPGAAILSDRLWRQRFGGDPGILGRAIDLDGAAHTVVGVLPAGIGFPDDATDLWIPRVDEPNFLNRGNVDRGSTYLGLVARLKPDVSPAAARADLDRLAATDLRTGFLDEGLRYRSLPIAEASTREARPTLLLLTGGVVLVLLIACADVTNLLLVRAVERRREVAVRKALGAGRARLVRQFLVESVVMAGAAAVAGVGLAKAALPALAALAVRQRLPRAPEIGLDLRVLAFTSAVAVATGVIFGLAPAIQGAGTDIRTGLLETSRTTRGDSRRRRIRGFLVAGEVALAVVLLVGAGLVLRTILRLEAVDPGFRPERLVAARVELPPSRYARPESMRAFFMRLRESLAALPGVESVGAAQSLPLSADRPQTLVAAEGGPLPPMSERPIVSLDTVAFDYFRTLGIPLVAGRTFGDADGPDAPLRIVVN
ncbi:MAG TPA: ABC transporter permease, partial [Thermoanaerobaculia bacterium]|nr:ABC transporter permease [Thermoanaerobaculia bacterium]